MEFVTGFIELAYYLKIEFTKLDNNYAASINEIRINIGEYGPATELEKL